MLDATMTAFLPDSLNGLHASYSDLKPVWHITTKVEYRVDKQAIVHLSIGKVSFGAEKLSENARAFLTSLNSQKPSSLKGVYVKSVAIATTMGPGIKVENSL